MVERKGDWPVHRYIQEDLQTIWGYRKTELMIVLSKHYVSAFILGLLVEDTESNSSSADVF